MGNLIATVPKQKREDQRRYLKVMRKWWHNPRSLVVFTMEWAHGWVEQQSRTTKVAFMTHKAMSGAFVVDCGFVMGEGEFFELGIEFSVEWGCSDIMIEIEYAQIVCFQENNCFATLLDTRI
ncbi:hypothetical protein FCV25MIE_33817, partial [Fagus crenata]